LSHIAEQFGLEPKSFAKQYKNHLSDFLTWKQRSHAEQYILFPENIGKRVSIDETSLTNGELYTIITNKNAKGRRRAIIAIIKGTKSGTVCDVLRKLPSKKLMAVREVTLDMSHSMDWIVTECFMNAEKVIDRFHVQQLVSEALQEMRIKLRWEAIEEENKMVAEAKKNKEKYKATTYENEDTKKQLLARGRYLLFKPKSKWTESQQERATILFREFPILEEAYRLSMQFRFFYEYSKTKEEGKEKLDDWYEKVKEKTKKKESPFASFVIAMKSIRHHEGRILNYFTGRSTNASAESFNAKIKGFRALVRGVTDKKFFLFRIAKIYG
jgi:transposase